MGNDLQDWKLHITVTSHFIGSLGDNIHVNVIGYCLCNKKCYVNNYGKFKCTEIKKEIVR